MKWKEPRAELESSVEAKGCEYAFKRGWFEAKLTSPSANGWPDRFYARDGVIILVEWKRDEDTEPSPQQSLRHTQLRKYGVRVEVIGSMRKAREVFR